MGDGSLGIRVDVSSLEESNAHYMKDSFGVSSSVDYSVENSEDFADESICLVLPNDFSEQGFGPQTADEFMENNHEDGGTDGYRDLLCDGVFSNLQKIKNRSDKLFSRLCNLWSETS